MRKPHLPLLAGLLAASCAKTAVPQQHFYDQQVQPIFNSFCVGNTSPCHKVNTGTGTALGNLDLTSFEAVHRRADALRTYGIYGQPLLLMKALPEESVPIAYAGQIYNSEIRHAGGKALSANSDAYRTIKRWLDNGATRDGLPPASVSHKGQGSCNNTPPDGERPVVDHNGAAFRAYVTDVAPLLATSCAFGTCHSSPQADLYLTCGDDDAQQEHNFLTAAGFVADAPASVEQSEILLRPLDPRAGGVSHTGGIYFSSRDDDTWKRLREWARLVQADPPALLARSAGETFFTDRVMPVLLRRGCAVETCHSPNGFNDFRLRPGAPGFLSHTAVHRNYETALGEFVALDSVDVRQSRLVKKNIYPANGQISHRGGSLLETPGTDSVSPCPQPYDPAKATAFCTMREWHRLERIDHAADVSPLTPGSKLPLAFVSRPADGDSLLEFDTFRGGADLKLADATVGENGRLDTVDNVRSALSACAALTGHNDLDVRGPEWSYDSNRLVFAARIGQSGGLDLWLIDRAANSCRRLTNDNGRMEGTVRVHNFDPTFAPDGSLVFASTRTGTRTLKRLLPNSDLFRVSPDLDFNKAEAMTWLLNAELSPAFMQNGQLTFTAEKATANFYQLSGRRINWDRTDYHPLLAQRAQSPDTFGNSRPSVGYQQATEIREGLDRNFLVILSDADARGGGGALATFNRSVGPFESGREEETFVKSLVVVDPAATAHPGTRGIYRSPYSLPNGEILASYAADVTDPTRDTPRYDLVAVDPLTATRRPLLAGNGQSLVEAALGYKRAERLLFQNVPQLVFGGRGNQSTDGRGTMHLPDFPLLATLLGANLRRGRNLEAFKDAATLKVYEEIPPDSATPAASDLQGPEQVFTRRKALGTAPLESDGSVKVSLPASKPLILELLDRNGKALFTMQEEHQVGPGEVVTPGVPRRLFNAVCAGCHGSLSGKDIDVAVNPDALTGASVSLSRELPARALQ